MNTLYEDTYASPLGLLRLVASDAALTGVYFEGHRHAPRISNARCIDGHPVLLHAVRELREYFHGERHDFTTPLAATGTAFQQAVWAALTRVPFGENKLTIISTLGDFFFTVTPRRLTRSGRIGWARLTRFWTSTWARLCISSALWPAFCRPAR